MRLGDYGEPSAALVPLPAAQVLWVGIPEAPTDIALTYWAMNALIGAALLVCLYVWLRRTGVTWNGCGVPRRAWARAIWANAPPSRRARTSAR